MFKVNNKKHQNDVIGVVLVSLLLTLNIFHAFFLQCFIVDFEQVNACWEINFIYPGIIIYLTSTRWSEWTFWLHKLLFNIL